MQRYGKHGEYVCFDVHPFRTTKVEHWLAHLDNSRRTFFAPARKKLALSMKRKLNSSSLTAITQRSINCSSNT